MEGYEWIGIFPVDSPDRLEWLGSPGATQGLSLTHLFTRCLSRDGVGDNEV